MLPRESMYFHLSSNRNKALSIFITVVLAHFCAAQQEPALKCPTLILGSTPFELKVEVANLERVCDLALLAVGVVDAEWNDKTKTERSFLQWSQASGNFPQDRHSGKHSTAYWEFRNSSAMTSVSRTLSTLIQTSKLGSVTLDLKVFEKESLNSKGGGSNGGARSQSCKVFSVPAILSLLPFVATIGVAIWTKQVLVALLAGMYVGSLWMAKYNPFVALLKVGDTFLYNALAHSNMGLLVFTFLIAGMVGVMTKSAGFEALGGLFSKLASTSKRAQLATILSGCLMFFDDYSNCLVVGPTMRNVCDPLLVSREKLAFLVDSSAAPLASIAIIGTWIGFEIGLIQSQLSAEGITESGFSVFIRGLPSRFYSILMLMFVFTVALLGRDFGPMLTAERRARAKGEVLQKGAHVPSSLDVDPDLRPDPETPRRFWNAAIPIVTLIGTALVSIILNGLQNLPPGQEASLINVLANADTTKVLIWSTLMGSVVSIVLTVAQKLLTLEEAMNAWVAGIKAVITGLLILIFSWGIGEVSSELHTGRFIVQMVGEKLPAIILPPLVFMVSAAIAFSTGSSWGAMAILFPMVVPLSYSLDGSSTKDKVGGIVVGTVASVLSGSVFGDHCSPISDTTVLSSVACSCDHLAHVRTQSPYAITVASVSLLMSLITAASSLSVAPVMNLVGGAILVGVMRLVGKPVHSHNISSAAMVLQQIEEDDSLANSGHCDEDSDEVVEMKVQGRPSRQVGEPSSADSSGTGLLHRFSSTVNRWVSGRDNRVQMESRSDGADHSTLLQSGEALSSKAQA